MSLPDSNWNYPTRIWFGNGRLRDLPGACREIGLRNPLLVTDKGLAGLDIVQRARQVLSDGGIAHDLYSDVQGNPTGANVEHGCERFLQGGHDGVIALGGGSALDAGKAIAMIAGQSLPLWDFEDRGDNWTRADVAAIAPVITLPTTAGTGSEVGRAAVILDEAEHCKKIIFHPQMLARIVISDPELTLGLPANITAWTGLDALVHALEAWCAPGFHPMADGIALEAIRLINQWLPLAVLDGSDLEARGYMLVAASMGATAFQKGLGSIHSVSHVLGAHYNVHHGLANAIIMPYGLAQNASALAGRTDPLCQALGLRADSDIMGLVDYLVELRARLGIPHTLSELGLDDSRAQAIGLQALEDPSTASNARPLSARELEELFRAALDGDFRRIAVR